MPTLTSRRKQGDMFKYIQHPEICLTSGIFRNGSGSTIPAGTSLLAQPLKLSGGKWVPVIATDEANVGGLMFSDIFLGDSLANATDYAPSGTLTKVAVLTLGPAVVLKDALPANDVLGVALTWATIYTAFATIDKHIKFVDDPPTVETVYVNE